MSDAFYTGMRDTVAGPLIEKYGMALTLRRITPGIYNPNDDSIVSITASTIASTLDSFTDNANGFASFINGIGITVSGFNDALNNGVFNITNKTNGELHVTPVPNSVEGVGNPITIVSGSKIDYSCFGLVEEYSDYMVSKSLVKRGDKKILLSAKGLNVVPKIGDLIIFPDNTIWFIPEGGGLETSSFQPVQTLAPGGIPIMYTIQARQ